MVINKFNFSIFLIIRINNQTIKPTNSNVVCDDAKFISKYYPGFFWNNEMLKTAYKSLEASPLTQRVFTKPPTVMFRKVPN